MVVACIWFEIRINYQLDAIEYLFNLARHVSGLRAHLQEQWMLYVISFTYAAYVKKIITSIAPEDGHVSPKYVELK